MGAIRDTVEGKTQQATWEEFKRVRDELQEAQEDGFVQWPMSKKDAFEEMKKDGDGWVLEYRFKV